MHPGPSQTNKLPGRARLIAEWDDPSGRSKCERLAQAVNRAAPCIIRVKHLAFFAACLNSLRGLPKPSSRIRRVEAEVIKCERRADLLMVIVTLVHDARPVPFPKGVPA